MKDLEIALSRLDSSNEEERADAVLDLGGGDDPERVKTLIKILETDESRFVREAAAVALISIGTEAVAEELKKLFKSDDPYLRETAGHILQCLGDSAERALSELLADPDPEVRLRAVRAIGGSDCLASACELLRCAVEYDKDALVVACAAEYLVSKGCPGLAGLLEAARRRFSDQFLDAVVDEALKALKQGKPNKKSSRAQSPDPLPEGNRPAKNPR